MARKIPFRPENKITQPFNDGLVKIYAVTDTALPGYAPVKTLTQVATLRYEEQKLGVNRYYAAMQNQVKIQRVIRVPESPLEITTQDVAETEDGRRYRIDLVQRLQNVWPVCLDLTLVEFTQNAPEQPETEGDDNDLV